MPTTTFLNLSKDKQLRVLKAAEEEFANAKNGEIVIKNIIDKADIPRGSFYQYFESKEDVIDYIMELRMIKTRENFIKNLNEVNGDILEVFEKFFYNIVSGKNYKKLEFEKKILEHTKQFQEKRVVHNKKCKSNNPEMENQILNSLDREKYNIDNIDELTTVAHMILGIMIKNISDFKNRNESLEETMQNFKRDLNYLENGIRK